MKKYFKDYEEGMGFMKSLKRFMDYSRKNIKNKRDLEKLEKLYNDFMNDMSGYKRDYKLFRDYCLNK